MFVVDPSVTVQMGVNAGKIGASALALLKQDEKENKGFKVEAQFQHRRRKTLPTPQVQQEAAAACTSGSVTRAGAEAMTYTLSVLKVPSLQPLFMKHWITDQAE